MLNTPELYPFGYRAYYSEATPVRGRSAGHESVADIYAIYTKKKEGYDSWAFKSRVMRLTLQLIGPSFSLWVKQQLGNPYVNDKAVRFIDDCVRFILSGKREILTMHWFAVLDGNAIAGSLDATPIRTALQETLKVNEDYVGLGYVGQWLQHPRGLEDLIETLNLLFGPDRRVDDTLSARNISPKNPQFQRVNHMLNG